MITDLESDILECEVKWALESITLNKAGGGDGIPVELFQILKDDTVKVLYSKCQQIWKTQHSKNEDHGIWFHHFMANRWGYNGNNERFYFLIAKLLQMVTAIMKSKYACSWEEKLCPT